MVEILKSLAGIGITIVGIVYVLVIEKEENFAGSGVRYTGAPIWGGLLIVASSVYGVMISRRRKVNTTTCNVCYLVLNIFLVALLSAGVPFYFMNSRSWKGCKDLPLPRDNRPCHDRQWYESKCCELSDQQVNLGASLSTSLSALASIILLFEVVSWLLVCIVECCPPKPKQHSIGNEGYRMASAS